MPSAEKELKGKSEELPDNLEQTSYNIPTSPKECMSEDEIKKRLAGRAMEYLMFMDD